MTRRIRLLTLTLLVGGVVLFASSFYIHSLDHYTLFGDLADFVGTSMLLLGGCVIVRLVADWKLPVRLFYGAASALALARFLDLAEEFPGARSWSFIEFGHGNTAIRLLEGYGYVSVLVAVLLLLYELYRLKNNAIEEHRRFEELYERSQFLARVADQSPDAVFGCDVNGRVRTWNVGAERLFGYTRKEAIGMDLDNLLTDGTLKRGTALVEQVAQHDSVEKVLGVARRKNGDLFPSESSFALVSDGDNQPLGVSVGLRDVEEHLKSLREIKASRDMLSLALRNVDVGLFIMGPHRELLEYNACMEEITGLTPREADDITLEQIEQTILTGEIPLAQILLDNVLQRGEHIDFRNVTLHRPDGTDRICNLAVSPIMDENGDIVAAVGLVVDITERETLHAKLLQSQKMESIGRLAGGVAHDFNNILSGVMGYASMLRAEMGSHSPFARQLEAIEQSAARASDLTHQLLAFARGGAPDLQSVNLGNVIAKTMKLVSSSLDPNHNMTCDMTDDLDTVMADPTQLQQVIMNLCLNARDALGDTGEIHISATNAIVNSDLAERLQLPRRGACVRLSVEDNGCGVQPDVIQNMFDPFFSTKKHDKAYGLGLSVVYGIVQNHEGGILVESEPGQGTRIDVYLPSAGAKAAKVSKDDNNGVYRKGGDERILVVDDEELLRSLLRDVLGQAGYSILEASSGEQAIDIYMQEKGIDLVILDIIMPGMGGRATLEKLLEHDSNLRCIVCSGHGADSIDGALFKNGQIRYLPKPFMATEVMRSVRELLDA